MKRYSRLFLVAVMAALMLALTVSVHAQDKVEIKYVLWDSNQQPSYTQCAENFMKANPNISVKIEQLGWDDYWSGLQTGFASNDAPDVFTNHLAKYPQFAKQDLLVDLQPLMDRDKVTTDIYIKGLADLWARDGKRFGLPKDWDTIAIAYNKDMLKAAGVDPKVMETWTWNPKDGGDFGKVIAQLSIDEAGNNGTSDKFDKTKVKQYGFIRSGSGGFSGQTEWSWLAVPNGWQFTNGTWGDKYFYDDPKFIETIQWFADLGLVKGFAPAYDEVKNLGATTLFTSGKGAMTSMGSWQIGDFLKDNKVNVGFGLLPIGPEGRKSMFNGLADSIWIGSKHVEESWQWVKFAASKECEDIVGEAGVVFPAIQSGVEKSLKVRADKGVDVSAFTTEALDPKGTFLFPITDHGAEIASIMGPTMDSIILGEKTAADALTEANKEVNALFAQ
jgi:multiple sugar transport system substrate-binding protein